MVVPIPGSTLQVKRLQPMGRGFLHLYLAVRLPAGRRRLHRSIRAYSPSSTSGSPAIWPAFQTCITRYSAALSLPREFVIPCRIDDVSDTVVFPFLQLESATLLWLHWVDKLNQMAPFLAAAVEDTLRVCKVARTGTTLVISPETWLPGHPVWLDGSPKATAVINRAARESVSLEKYKNKANSLWDEISGAAGILLLAWRHRHHQGTSSRHRFTLRGLHE